MSAPDHKLPLDDSFYSLKSEELAFFQEQTGILDEVELKKHIISVQEKAYEIFGYRCIRRFGFTQLKISRLPAYQAVLDLPSQRPDAIFLDIGCCFGNDIRKIVADGWPVETAIASDLHQGFWDYGHELFKSTPDTFPAAFIPGNAFDAAIIAPREPFYDESELATRPSNLRSLSSLTPLQGHISAIHASAFFHLFDEAQQLELARQLASLLSPVPGSVIFGLHGGRQEKGLRIEALNSAGKHMFCHSPQTWTELWDGEVFRKGTVRVDAGLHKMERRDLPATEGAEFFALWWSVTRL
ncbi:Methyltransferase ausD [Hypsizygus marmoreus]|uniref:Methyltransferase ausD n=1 Tax=Hypsizygus marmoreus TaxID=39966 RepID=A0A369JMK4_HYPMA|nr:Methyltransferase ausD [Hypsizygus marmoreus]